MIERSSRLAYTSSIRRFVAESALLTIEMHGVIPLPPLQSTRSRVERGSSTNSPAGGTTISDEPARTRSFIQFDTRPWSTRFTVTL
jgi:hypothetical protein